jgi:hypothetical protein
MTKPTFFLLIEVRSTPGPSQARILHARASNFWYFFVMLRSVLLAAALVAVNASHYGKRQKIDCNAKGTCTVSLGKAGTVTLPALVAFKSAHK